MHAATCATIWLGKRQNNLVAGLIDGHETVVVSATAAREAAGKTEDLETQDLCIKRIQTHEKTLWMLKSYLKNL